MRKLGAGAAIQGIGPGRRFRQRVSADDFTGSQPRQIFLFLLFGPEVDDGQGADAGVSAPSGGKAGVLGNVVGNHRGGDFVHLQAAVGFRNFGGTEAEFPGFLQQIASDGEVFVLDLFDVGKNLVDGKLLRRLANQLMLLGEIFRSEHFVGAALFKQKTAAGDFGTRNCGCRHEKPLFNHKGHKGTQGNPSVGCLCVPSCPLWLIAFHFQPVPFTNRLMPSFKCTTLKFISSPRDLPLSLRYESSWA